MPPETTTTSRQEIAANVRAAMARRGIEQREVATAINRSPASVSDRLRGHTHFRIDELQTIAALLRVDLEELLKPDAEARA